MNILYRFDKWDHKVEIMNNREKGNPSIETRVTIAEYYKPTWFGKLLHYEKLSKKYISCGRFFEWYDVSTDKKVDDRKTIELIEKVESLKIKGEFYKF